MFEWLLHLHWLLAIQTNDIEKFNPLREKSLKKSPMPSFVIRFKNQFQRDDYLHCHNHMLVPLSNDFVMFCLNLNVGQPITHILCFYPNSLNI